MNKTHLKRYAPQARKDFIGAVTQRAQLLGLSLEANGRIEMDPCTVQGDVASIAGRAWPVSVNAQRNALYERMLLDDYMRISLDLDDGVKVNYGKFGDLLGGGRR